MLSWWKTLLEKQGWTLHKVGDDADMGEIPEVVK
jgi:hypothetical protein